MDKIAQQMDRVSRCNHHRIRLFRNPNKYFVEFCPDDESTYTTIGENCGVTFPYIDDPIFPLSVLTKYLKEQHLEKNLLSSDDQTTNCTMISDDDLKFISFDATRDEPIVDGMKFKKYLETLFTYMSNVLRSNHVIRYKVICNKNKMRFKNSDGDFGYVQYAKTIELEIFLTHKSQSSDGHHNTNPVKMDSNTQNLPTYNYIINPLEIDSDTEILSTDNFDPYLGVRCLTNLATTITDTNGSIVKSFPTVSLFNPDDLKKYKIENGIWDGNDDS
jgi:hypothetical protein